MDGSSPLVTNSRSNSFSVFGKVSFLKRLNIIPNSKGLFIVDDYINIESVLLNYGEAYGNFENAARLGHVGSMYHLGFLHEIAAEYGHIQDSKTIAENLSKSSHYYGVCFKYDFPKSEEALIRIVLESSKKIKHIEEDNSRNVSLETNNDGIFKKYAYSIVPYWAEKSHID